LSPLVSWIYGNALSPIGLWTYFPSGKVSCPAQHHHWRYQELKLVEEGAPEEALDLGKQLGLLEVSVVFEAELLLDEGYVEGERLGDVTEDGHGLLD